MYEFKFPFEPPWEDLKLTVDLPGGGHAYVFDSCVERDPEKRAVLEQKVAEVLMNIERRKFMEACNAKV